MTTPNLASVAIRPLRRPTAPSRGAGSATLPFRLPVFVIAEIIAAFVLLFVGYTAVTDNWFSTGVETFSEWYTEAVAPYFDPPLDVRRPADLGPIGLAEQQGETSPFS